MQKEEETNPYTLNPEKNCWMLFKELVGLTGCRAPLTPLRMVKGRLGLLFSRSASSRPCTRHSTFQ